MAVVTFVNVCYLTLSMRVTNIGTNFSAKTFEKDYSYDLINFDLWPGIVCLERDFGL